MGEEPGRVNMNRFANGRGKKTSGKVDNAEKGEKGKKKQRPMSRQPSFPGERERKFLVVDIWGKVKGSTGTNMADGRFGGKRKGNRGGGYLAVSASRRCRRGGRVQFR